MKTVISISLGASSQDFEFTTTFLGQAMKVRRLGTDGSTARALKLLKTWDGKADAIGLGVLKDSYSLGARRFIERDTLKLSRAVARAPVSNGQRLGDILLEWAVRHAQNELGRCFDNARVLFFSGMAQRKLAHTMSEYSANLLFADPLLQLGVPKLLTSLGALQLYGNGAHALSSWVPPRVLPATLLREWAQFVLRKALVKASVVVAPAHELDAFGLEELAGKTVVTQALNEHRLAQFKDKGVHLVVDGSAEVEGHVLGPETLDAMILAAVARPPAEILDDDYLEIIGSLQLRPRILYPGGYQRINRFAFVIHPLSQEYFKVLKPVQMLSQVSPPVFMDSLERVMAYAPPFVYTKVEGIRSPTGTMAEGWLISVGGTPREIMRRPPEFTYRRLLAAAEMARRLGAQIMGLGAFTKVVGDAGVTVAKRAPLPITTGNSYSASAALWAAHDALLRMRLLPPPKGKERVAFQAMVVGATGAIGSACARLLARAAEQVTLVSPETAKLLALQQSILHETPDAKLVLASRADTHIGQMDMVVTATSGAGKKVLDIMKVKPGCVITDVARPLDLPPEEVAKRPDVLVIESGEILMPGDVKMKDIGLPPGVAYACLAETIVLALEGRFENFTVGRAIEWEKVREIYKMGLKHGMKLAAISGVNGVITDADIERVRTLALAARAKAAAPGKRSRAKAGADEAQAAPAKKAPAKKAPAKKPAAVKAAAKKGAAEKAPARRAPAKAPTARKTTARKTAVRPTVQRGAAARKA